MNGLLLCILVYIGFIIAYHTYGRFIGSKLFEISKKVITPAHELNDGIDYVPAKKEVLFGHHFATIAGTGPIVGPAIGVIWGWVPALIWVFVGSIVMGGVHDLGALIISTRNKGKSIGDITKDIVSPTSHILFLLVIFFCLVIVVSIFAMIIGILFNMYPSAVFPVWMEIPLAIALGYLVYKKGKPISYTAIPMIFMVIMTSWAMIVNTINFAKTNNWLLLGINSIILLFVIWMIIEVIMVIHRSVTNTVLKN